MIKATKLNGKEFYINPHMIEFMESTPDTVIKMFSDRKILVKEKPDEIINKIMQYRTKIGLLGNDTHL